MHLLETKRTALVDRFCVIIIRKALQLFLCRQEAMFTVCIAYFSNAVSFTVTIGMLSLSFLMK